MKRESARGWAVGGLAACILATTVWLSFWAVRTMEYDRDLVQATGNPNPAATTLALRAATQVRPDLSDGWRMLAVDSQVDNIQRARAEAVRAVATDPDDWRNWAILGSVDFQLNHLSQAHDDLRHATTLNNGYDSHFQLANMAWVLGDQAEFWAQMAAAMQVAGLDQQAELVNDCLRLAPDDIPHLESIVPYGRPSMSITVAQGLSQTHHHQAALDVLRKSNCADQLHACRQATLQIVDQALQALTAGTAPHGVLAGAIAAWNHAVAAGALGEDTAAIAKISDGGFAHAWEGPAFSWAHGSWPQVQVGPGPTAGENAAEVRLSGAQPDNVTLFLQLVPVSPDGRYQVNFSAQTAASNASGIECDILLSQRADIPLAAFPIQASTDWQPQSGQFSVPAGTDLITLVFAYHRPFATPPWIGSVRISGVSLRALPQKTAVTQ